MKERKKLKVSNDSQARMVLLLAIMTNFMGTFAASAINLSIAAISAEFHGSAELTGWIITGFLLGNVVFSIPFGRIADLTGRKRIYALGVGIFMASSLVSAFSVSTGMLIVSRLAQGVGGAMLFSTNMAVLVDAYPPQKRGKALGLAIAAAYIGLSAGPTIGGTLSNYFGWRSIFAVLTIIGIISLVLIATKLPNDSRQAPARDFDLYGNVLYIAAISCILCGVSLCVGHRWTIVLIPSGFAVGVFFVRHELKSATPVLDVRLLAGNRNYVFSNLASLLNYAFDAGLIYYVAIYLQLVKGFNPMISGAVMIGQPLFQAIVSPYAGKLSDRISPFKIATVGMAICLAGLFSFCFIGEGTPLACVIGILVLIGTGFGVFSSPNSNAIMSCVEPKDFAAATSLQMTMKNLGQTISLCVVTSIMTAHIGKTALVNASKSALIVSMRTGFIIFTVLCAIGIFFSIQRKSK